MHVATLRTQYNIMYTSLATKPPTSPSPRCRISFGYFGGGILFTAARLYLTLAE